MANRNGHVLMYHWNSTQQEKVYDILTTSTKLAAVFDELSEFLMFGSNGQLLISYHRYSRFIMS